MAVTIADVATTGSDLVNTVAVVAGDYIDFQLVCTDTPSSRYAAIGMCFVATTNGESLVLGSNRLVATVSTQQWMHAQADKDNLAWTTTELNVNQLGQSCVLRSLYVRLSASPGNFNTHILMLRDAGNTALTCTVTGPATTASDTTHSVSIANGDLIDMQDTVSGGTAVTVHWGMVCYVTPYTLPTVATTAATNVEETSVTLNGNMTATGGENADYRGFVYDTSSHVDPGNVAPAASGYAWNWTENGSFGAVAFSHGISGLTQGQIYYYRSCCHNSVGWDYGNTEESFTTKPEAPTSFSANSPTTSTINVSWVKGTGAMRTYIRGEDGSYPTDKTDGYLVYNDTATSCQDIGLTPGHRYYYRAWSWVNGTVYSDGYVQDNEITLYSTPSVTSATPNLGSRGVAGQVETINGTGFTGVTSVSFGSGITVTGFAVNSDVNITANITIAWDAILGFRNVSATNTGGTGVLVNGFTVNVLAPVIASVVPNFGNQGVTSYGVTVNGVGFINSTVVGFGADINVTGFAVNSYSQITTSLNITGGAALGFRNVSVTTPGGVGILVNGFEVKAGGGGNVTLTIGAVVPNEGARSNTLNVTIVGTGFTGLSNVDFGSDILVNSFAISSNTTVSTSITINDTAVLGARNVSITGPSGIVTLVGGFTVTTDIGSVLGIIGLFGFGLIIAIVLSVFAWRVRFILLNIVAAAAWLGMLIFLLTNTSSPGLTWLGTAGVTILSLVFIGMCVAMLLLQIAVDTSGKNPGGSVWRRTSLQMNGKPTTAESQADYRKRLRDLRKPKRRGMFG
jgi:hypothetical protein